MSYSFGKTSRSRLDTCHPDLVKLVEKALSYGVMDISVLEGNRSTEKQKQLYAEGKSQLDGVNKLSKHQSSPSVAVDLMPYPGELNGKNIWTDTHRWCVLGGLMYAAASELGIKIRWGGDWDGDGNNSDSNFNDYPHFELI